MWSAQRFIGAESLPSRMSELDVQQFFSLSKNDISAVCERCRRSRQVESRSCCLIIGRQRRLAARFLQALDYAIFSDDARRQMAMKSRLPLTARE